MEHTIEQVAKVLAANWRNMHTNESLGQQRMLARALAEAGFLAPAPLREVQAEAWAECSQWHAEQGMPVNGAGDEHNPYRAECDGRA